MNDEFLKDYFMLFGQHKDRIIIEIPVNQSEEKNFYRKASKEITTIYIENG